MKTPQHQNHYSMKGKLHLWKHVHKINDQRKIYLWLNKNIQKYKSLPQEKDKGYEITQMWRHDMNVTTILMYNSRKQKLNSEKINAPLRVAKLIVTCQ